MKRNLTTRATLGGTATMLRGLIKEVEMNSQGGAGNSELEGLRVKLAKYEQAEMPEYPHTIWSIIGDAVLQKHYDILRAFAAAETVRADENERDAVLWRNFMKQVDAIKASGFAETTSTRGILIGATVKDQP